jgi:hypothetical protein
LVKILQYNTTNIDKLTKRRVSRIENKDRVATERERERGREGAVPEPLVGRRSEKITKSVLIEMGLGFVVGVFGALILAHAAYSTIQCKPFIYVHKHESM